jgi:hypothetical protein
MLGYSRGSLSSIGYILVNEIAYLAEVLCLLYARLSQKDKKYYRRLYDLTVVILAYPSAQDEISSW